LTSPVLYFIITPEGEKHEMLCKLGEKMVDIGWILKMRKIIDRMRRPKLLDRVAKYFGRW